MTSGGRRPPNTVQTLALALGDACVVEIVTTTCTGKLSVALRSAHHTADLLGRHRGRLRFERLPALAASTPHRRNVRRRRGGSLSRRAAESRCGGVGQYPAAKWISLRPPLKSRLASGSSPSIPRRERRKTRPDSPRALRDADDRARDGVGVTSESTVAARLLNKAGKE